MTLRHLMVRRTLAALFAMMAASGCAAEKLVWWGRSPDRAHRIEVVEEQGRQHVRVDGAPGARYLGIGVDALVVSRVGARVVYPAQKVAGRWVVVVDGREGLAWDGIGEIALSADGRRVAYVAERGTSWHIVLDGEPVREAAEVLSDSLTFSRDGSRLAWAESDGRSARAVVDGVPQPAFDGIAEITFRSDGRQIAYAARRGSHWHAVVNGRVGDAYDDVAGLTFGSRRLAFAARRVGRAFAVVDGDEGRAFKEVVPSSLRFVRDDQLLFVARSGGQLQLVASGEPGPLFDAIDGPAVARNGEHWGYVGRRAGASVIVVDGRPVATLPAASDLVFTNDGLRHAYLTRMGPRMAVVVDDVPRFFDLVVEGSLVFTDDGAHLACLAGDRHLRTLFFAVDGKRVADFAIEELNAAVLFPRQQGVDLLRSWVAAEAKIYLAGVARRQARAPQ